MGENKVGVVLKGATGMRDAMKALEMAGPGISERVLRPMVVDWNNGRAGEWVGLLAVVPMCADGDGDDDDGSSWSGREGSAEFGGNPSEMREIVCVRIQHHLRFNREIYKTGRQKSINAIHSHVQPTAVCSTIFKPPIPL